MKPPPLSDLPGWEIVERSEAPYPGTPGAPNDPGGHGRAATSPGGPSPGATQLPSGSGRSAKPRKRRGSQHISRYWPPDREDNRRLGELLRSGPCRVVCVWTGLVIRDSDEIALAMGLGSGGLPHLWNLMPFNGPVRCHQGDELASDSLLGRSRERILAWWDLAYGEAPYRERFFREVREGLVPPPKGGDPAVPSWEEIFEALRDRHAQYRHHGGTGGVGWSPYGERVRVAIDATTLGQAGGRHGMSIMWGPTSGRCDLEG